MSQSLRVQAGDASLAVRIDGDAARPWLILSNSLAADMSMWTSQIDEFARRRRVVRYDTRGHGASSAPPGPYDFNRLVADVVAILDHLEIGQADMVGLSLGGMTALGLGLSHPERIRRLVCCDARAEFPPAALAGWDQRMQAVRAGGVAAIIEETLARWFTPATFSERPEIIAAARAMMLATPAEGYLGCVSALKALDYKRLLPQLGVPTLYVVGEQDGGAPPEVMREMADATPQAQFALLPAAAHIANWEAAEAFNVAVLGFLLAPDAKRA